MTASKQRVNILSHMAARGIEQGFKPPVPEAQQSQAGVGRLERGLNKGIIAPVIRGEPFTHRAIAKKSNVFVGYANGQRLAEEPQRSPLPPTESELWIATDRYWRGKITREQLAEVEHRDAEVREEALFKLHGITKELKMPNQH